jgi:hypothetical protein
LAAPLIGHQSLSSRLFRDGFHSLAVLPSGGIVAAVARSIVTLRAGDNKFCATHTIARGTRPLHITAVPAGAVFWGEYFDNAARDEVHIYASSDAGATWAVAYTVPWGAIRHVHNVIHDPWEDCLWVLTGDCGDECRILRASCDFSRVETVLQGNQQAGAVALVPLADGLYFSSDTPLETNYVYRLDRQRKLSQIATISSSSIYGCRVGDQIFFPPWWNRARSIATATSVSMAAMARTIGSPCSRGEKTAGPWACFSTATPFCPTEITPRLTWP